jgi:5-methyltetrahydrofolate--homocysteine methyltransferase
METRLSGATKEVIIGHDRPTVLIGERINPTGKKKMSEALKAGELEIVRQEALTQVQAGADIIDVNVAATGVNEVTRLPQAVRVVNDTVDVPLCLDSPNPEALEAALKVYKGKPLLNSVTGEEHSLERVLPLVKEYGAAVIGLVQDEEGVPGDAERRLAIAHKIVERAEAIGIPRQDIIIDCLAFAVGADPRSGLVILETIRRIKAELGVNLTLGASNVSFGMPDRSLLNSAFVAMVIAAGVTCLIVDAAKVRPMALAADLVLGQDAYARRYIRAYRERQKPVED